jgi:hypothetical protein
MRQVLTLLSPVVVVIAGILSSRCGGMMGTTSDAGKDATSGSSGSSFACGGTREPCCTGSTCRSGLTCSAGLCSGSSAATASGDGEALPSDAGKDATTRSMSSSSACGYAFEPCCSGSICYDGVACASLTQICEPSSSVGPSYSSSSGSTSSSGTSSGDGGSRPSEAGTDASASG